jgi:bifunctional ADP-heptose synthase (sugar kinase/adenylyltransferase)
MVAAGADLHDAMRVANHAAGIVVGRLGTAVATRDELAASLAGGAR